MSYRYAQAAKLAGEKWVGSHECVALVQQYAKAPTTMHWKEGGKVRDANNLALAPQSQRSQKASTAIAGQVTMPFRNGQGSASNDGDAYAVIE